MYRKLQLSTGRLALIAALLGAGLSIFQVGVTQAQARSADAGRILSRLGIPASSLDGVRPEGLETVCQSGQRGTDCDVNYTTRSDEVCRAVAIGAALHRRAIQLEGGGSARVIMRVHCSSGVFAVFQTSARRAVIGHRDSAGNTGQREIPL